jgi:hypothetical protein
MKSKDSIHYLVSEGAGIRPIKSGINHILRNIDSVKELEMCKIDAVKTRRTCNDWEEFKAELLKQETYEIIN